MPLRGPIQFQFNNLDEVERAVGQLSAQARKIAAEELNMTAESIMTQSKEIVPVQTGRLRSSGHVASRAFAFGNTSLGLGITLAYGAIYAAQVHEAPQEQRKSGVRKYLERPMMSESAAFPKVLADALRQRLGKGKGGGIGGPGGGGLL